MEIKAKNNIYSPLILKTCFVCTGGFTVMAVREDRANLNYCSNCETWGSTNSKQVGPENNGELVKPPVC